MGDQTLFSLSFEDDQIVVAQDAYDLEFMVTRLYLEYSEWMLQVSLSKTKYLAFITDASFEVIINNNVRGK